MSVLQPLFHDSRDPHALPQEMRVLYGVIGELLSLIPAPVAFSAQLIHSIEAGGGKPFTAIVSEDDAGMVLRSDS